jgi:hypothetical protein
VNSATPIEVRNGTLRGSPDRKLVRDPSPSFALFIAFRMTGECSPQNTLSAEPLLRTYPMTQSASNFSEDLLHLPVYREATDVCFREDHFAVHHHVKLAGLTRLYLGSFAEARVE